MFKQLRTLPESAERARADWELTNDHLRAVGTVVAVCAVAVAVAAIATLLIRAAD